MPWCAIHTCLKLINSHLQYSYSWVLQLTVIARCCSSLSQLGVAANKFMPKFKLEGFHNHWLIFLWILHSPFLVTVILFSENFVFFVSIRDKLNFEHWRQKWFKHFVQIVNNSNSQVYAYFQWSHFRRSDSSMLILPTEKYSFMNARIWEINFPWNDGAKNWWSMEWCCRPMTDWNQASI